MNYQRVAVAVALVASLSGCDAEREVEVSGKVTASSSVAVGDKVVVDFIDVVGDGDSAKQTIALTTDLQSPGDFKETVSLEGDQVLVRAIDDRDGDGKCTAGEAWGETHAPISQGKAEAVLLMLQTAACPAE